MLVLCPETGPYGCKYCHVGFFNVEGGFPHFLRTGGGPPGVLFYKRFFIFI